jgi:hypothetical protein
MQQLTPERLAAAQARWTERGLKNYDMEYTQDGGTTAVFEVRVRGGVVREVTMNGKPLEPRLRPSHSMDALFAFVEEFLRQDRTSNRSTFTVATFDQQDGHLLRYVRRVAGTTERVELRVTKLVEVDS